MSQGPIIIFDKSTLESLNADESVWLDNFFLTNITPLFFIETLADLEKEVRSGRTPEDIVGNLALKTPDMQSYPNVHHASLIYAELAGQQAFPMDGRPMIAGGRAVSLDGQTGVMFQSGPEVEAFHRWRRHEFLEIERQIAKAWRHALSSVDYEDVYRAFRTWFSPGNKPTTLAGVKAFVDQRIDGIDQESSFRFGMGIHNIAPEYQDKFLIRWRELGKPPIREYCPYFRHVYSVDLFFYLGIATDLISRVRPSNKVDLAYLYYLPFCYVFTSNDNLHSRIAPIFMRADQTFVRGTDLKSDLAQLDRHYALLPDSVKIQGLFHFANYPPNDVSFLVTRLWDKHLSSWRELRAKHQPLDKKGQIALMELMKRLETEGIVVGEANVPQLDEADFMQIQRSVPAKKGKWMRFSPEVIKNSQKQTG